MRGGGQNLRFLDNKSLYLINGARWDYRLLLITNRKSYTSSRLPPISITFDDLERLNRDFLWIFWRFWAARHFSRANCAETN